MEKTKVKIDVKKEKNVRKRNEKAITLIALIVTIIVLLIIAGVTIATLTGENGILTRAKETKTQTEEAEDIEKIKLAVSEAQIGEIGYQKLDVNSLHEALDNQFEGRDVVVLDNGDGTFTISCLDTLKDYIISDNSIEEGIDWNEAMMNAIAPASQDEERNKGVIAIGTDGKPVDMDLWEYTLLEDGTFGLNDMNSLLDINKNKAYLGGFDNGKIIGTIPQYISTDFGKTFQPVTNLFATFCEISELIVMPTIPNTVSTLTNAFIRCENLGILTNISSKVSILGSTFKGCTSLEKSMEIPYGVTNIYGIFSGCTNLKNGPSNIPETVTNMQQSFLDCVNLSGDITVNANVTGYPVVSIELNDFYRCFYGATLKENNVHLNVFLKKDIYQLFNEQITKVYDSKKSNITLKEQ